MRRDSQHRRRLKDGRFEKGDGEEAEETTALIGGKFAVTAGSRYCPIL